ncbi:MAG: 4Fe-4S dicluster domain-containing protein [Chloroflexi bacterium]|nr:4Fe-4S dicluster domain-containing protein [Chloroflexota bacterium]
MTATTIPGAVVPAATPATRVDGGLLADIRRFGAADVNACFSCGVCTATCPLVTNDGTFPRRMIRYAQLGLRDKLLSSRELWTCYACGQCSEQCPQQAEPGEFMAATRRWAVASYDRTSLARTLATRPLAGSVIAVLLAVILAAFMYTAHGPMGGSSLELFGFIPSDLIHNLGIAVMAIVLVTGGAGLAAMVLALRRSVVVPPARPGRAVLAAAWRAIAVEALGQQRYRGECETETRPWYRQRWFVHAATMWGFLGLLGATLLDYGLELLGIKATGTPVPIWYPVRLLGTVAGLALLYGSTLLILRRARAEERSLRHSTVGDWMFLVLLWLAGATGFVLELALYLPGAPAWGYAVFLVHVAVALELVLLVPFSKFAHAIYRPVALFFLALATSSAEPAGEGSR